MASVPEVVVGCRAAFPDHTAICRRTITSKTVKKKTKSKGHLVHRSAGLPPFSAWVEPVKASEPRAAMQNARGEQTRMQNIINQREERLKEFQEGVKDRVKQLERIKRQEQLGNTYKASEYERNVVQQSSFPRKPCLAKRDTCVYRDNSELTIKLPITRASVIHDHNAVDSANQLLEKHADQIRTSTKHARGVLLSKSVPVEEEQLRALPGGLWSLSPTRDHGSSRQANPITTLQESPPENTTAIVHPSDLVNGEGSLDRDYWIGDDAIRDTSMSLNEEKENKINSIELPSWITGQENVTIFKPLPTKGSKENLGHRVRFAGAEIISGKPAGQCAYLKGSSLLNRKAIESLIKPGKIEEEKKCQAKNQMAVYRRLFMDMEREQVREHIRMKEHRKRMAEVKVEKEIKRLEAEHQQKLVAATQMSPEKQRLPQAVQENIEYQQYLEQQHEKLQRSKETERYVDAMRAMLKEKMHNKGIQLPPMCACGPTVWDASPDSCANNCVFYKNPKAYVKAMSSLLGSLDS